MNHREDPAPRVRVAVILLNWNCWPDTLRALETVEASQGVELDVLVVDNGSADDSRERLAERVGPDRLIALPENTGYAGGMNAGLERWLAAEGPELALILTKDALVDAGMVRRLADVMGSEPRCGIAGPLVVYRKEPRWLGAGGALDPGRARVRQLPEPAAPEPYPVDWVDGCCMMVRRGAVVEVGGFDPRYFIYFEETDLCTRMRAAGWSVVMVPDTTVWHPKDDGHPEHYFYYMVRNRYLFWRKNFGLGRLRVSGSVLGDTARAAGSYLVSLARPERRARRAECGRILRLQTSGAVLGTLHHLQGRYGPAAGVRGKAAAPMRTAGRQFVGAG